MAPETSGWRPVPVKSGIGPFQLILDQDRMRLKQSDTVLGWQSHSAAIMVSSIQNYSNCRLRQIPEKERVKTGVQQLFAIADKATQPEQPCAIHEYRAQKDRDRCSE